MLLTRRQFFEKLIGTGVLALGSICWLGRKINPQRFVIAQRNASYPGTIKPLSHIMKNSQWLG